MKCLIVEDDGDFASIVARRLQPTTVDVVPTREDALRAIVRDKPDIVLLDLSLPDSDASSTMDFIAEVKRQAPGALVVVITGDPRDSTRTSALLHGADRFLEKDARDFMRSVADLVQRPLRCTGADALAEIERRVKSMTDGPLCAPRMAFGSVHPAAMLRG